MPHRFEAKRDDQAPEPFVLERLDEPLDQRDAAVLVDSSIARTDVLSLAPGREAAARELRSLVANEMLGTSLRLSDDSLEEGPHGRGSWLLLEDGESKDQP